MLYYLVIIFILGWVRNKIFVVNFGDDFGNLARGKTGRRIFLLAAAAAQFPLPARFDNTLQ